LWLENKNSRNSEAIGLKSFIQWWRKVKERRRYKVEIIEGVCTVHKFTMWCVCVVVCDNVYL